MKKFLTFFAMMFALLGFTTPVSAADYNLYVDISAKGWSDVYLKVRWVDRGQNGWYVPGSANNFKKENLGNGLYKLSFTENKFDALIISNNDNASDLTLGANNIGWFKTGNTGDFKYENGALYTLVAGNENLVTKGTYSEPPYIYIDSTCKPFEKDGSNWVYTIDATSGDKDFRIQNKNDVSATPGEKIQFGCEGGMTIDATATKSIKLYGSGNHKWTAKKGAQYVLEIPTSTAIPTEYNKSINLKITKKSVSQPPYILMKGASGCEQFVSSTDGSRWEYKIENAAQGAEFRLQTQNYTGEGQSNTVLYGSTTSIGKTTSSIELWLYGNSGGYFTINDAGTYVISFDKTENLASTNPNGPHTLYVVFTETKPATPVLPPTATDNKIVIPAVSGAQIYYTETTEGDPSTSTWTPYPEGGIPVENHHMTIRAAAYKAELGDKAWSDVTVQKTYAYVVNVVPNIEIDVHTGIATITADLSKIPASANAKILYSCGPAAPGKVYSAPVDMATECTVEGATRYPIKALVRAWGGGDDYTTKVENQTIDSDVRNAQWVGPAAVRRICLWSYSEDGNPVKLDEFSKQADGSYTLSYSPVSGTDSSKANQRYFIRVVMNHDEPNDVVSDTGGTFYSLSTETNGVTTVASGVESIGYHNFTPSASDVRGMFFAGTDRDLVNLTLKGELTEYTLPSSTTKCKRFVPESILPTWVADANIKSVELRDANGKVLCTLTQNTGTGETNYWTGITTVALPKAADNSKDEIFHFVAETKDGTKYYSLGTDSNYWLSYGRYDETTSPKPSTSSSSGYYFCVKETSAIAQVAIAFDGTTASKISISPYTDTKKMDISGDPQAPAIYGYGSEVGSWDNAREFNQSPTLDGWVYTFIATQSTGEFLIRGSKNHLYAPIGLGFDSPTNVWRQVPDSYTDAASKKRAAAKISGLQVGARYRFILQDVGGQVQMSIEANPESVRSIKKAELYSYVSGTSTKLLDMAYDKEMDVWNTVGTYHWDGNLGGEDDTTSPRLYVKYYVGYENDQPEVYSVRYVGWTETSSDYTLQSTSQYSNKPVTFTSLEEDALKTFKVRPSGKYYVQVAFDKSNLKAGWIGMSTSMLAPSIYPEVETKSWSLSDENVMKTNEHKYFYMSALQNDNRLSPEWELIKQADGKYVLDNFVVIPGAEFRIREVYKKSNGKFEVHDWGYDNVNDVKAAAFGLTSDTQAAADSKPSADFAISTDKSRGIFWNIGATMVRLEFDPSASAPLKAIIDFSYPSTLKQAPKPGFPWVGLTSSNITAASGTNQTYSYAGDLGIALGTDGLTQETLDKMGMTVAELNGAFTNAFIQWTTDGKPYVYDGHVNEIAENTNTEVYYIPGKPEEVLFATTKKPQAGQVMSSTILPPRVSPQLHMTTVRGVATPSAESLTFTYHGVTTPKEDRNIVLSQDGTSVDENTRFAVYEIQNVELQGMFKVFTGYGARQYGATTNGLSWYANWGVGSATDGHGYDFQEISKTSQLPLNGGGALTKSDGTAERGYDDKTYEDKGPWNYDERQDNAAGNYFLLADRKYVPSLKFYLALDCDYPTNRNKFHNRYTKSGRGDFNDYYNVGRNYSWLSVNLTAERPIITLDKVGANTGHVRYWLNEDKDETKPVVKSFRTLFVRIPDEHLADWDFEPTTCPVKWDAANNKAVLVKDGTEIDITSSTYGGEFHQNVNQRWIEPTTYDRANLPAGTYVAYIYDVDYDTSDGEYDIKDTDLWNTSRRIRVFAVPQGTVRGWQRVGARDDKKVYHPIIRVAPDVSAVIANLDGEATIDKVSATVTVTNIGPNTHFWDVNGNPLPGGEHWGDEAADKSGIYVTWGNQYHAATETEPEQEGVATVHYPAGYFSADRQNAANFDVCDTRINFMTNLAIQTQIEGGVPSTPYDVDVLTYMPAGKLYGKLVPRKQGDSFNYLAVTAEDGLPADEDQDDYARIRYVDKNDDNAICYIANVQHSDVTAKVWYVSPTGENIELFTTPLDMKSNPKDLSSENHGVYTAKRLKIGGIPYVADTDTDIDETPLSVRKKQTADFIVELTYTTGGFEPWQSRQIPTSLSLDAELLTSPRQGLRDVLTQADVDERNADAEGSGVAKDVTAVSESFIEKYGGLYTNIEDAHVALHAVPKNDALVGHNSLRQWYMDHGDKFADGTVNPFNPNSHLAVGNAKADGTTYDTPEEVHPMLRSENPVASTDGFRNDSELNNAWWNHNALVAPEFHTADQIKGTLTIEGGKVTGFTPGANKPKNHRSFWAGVKVDNNDAYKKWDDGYILKAPQGFDVDIRDPKHGYYGQSNHFSKERSGFYHGEMPLNLNDIVAVLGKGQGAGSDAFVADDRTGLYDDAQAVYDKAKEFHPYDVAITEAVNEGQSSVTVAGVTYPINWNTDYIWDYDPIYAIREQVAFEPADGGKAPADALFEAAGHMFFKVRHVNHESWFVPGANVAEGDLKTQPLWPAFKDIAGFPASGSAKEKDEFVMNQLRMNFSDYCPLAYDVRYTYPFLTSDQYVTAENYKAPETNARARKARSAEYSSISDAMNAAQTAKETIPGVVTDIVARDKGRVSFFGASEPSKVVPTAISDVNDDIRGKGFSIVYNRAAGTVTVKAEGKKLENAAVYDATGASLVAGAYADRIDENTIVLDVRNIARGAYVVGTNLGGAKFMK